MNDFYRDYLKTSVLGLEIGLSILVGGGLGYLTERYFDISPWGLIIGAGFGVATAGRTLYRFSKRYLKENP
ncbi:MAG: AtpZ/AtpI family protein [Myxococcaceae bacterium]